MPENTVLVNLAQIGRKDLLRLVAEGRATWCYTVSDECSKSARIEGLEQLGEAPDIFGDPLTDEGESFANSLPGTSWVLPDQLPGTWSCVRVTSTGR